jgi:MmeI, N-terminal domain
LPLSWNDIRDRAVAFSAEWRHAKSEDADAKSFWDDFFKVFGVDRKRVASFEKRVKKLDAASISPAALERRARLR